MDEFLRRLDAADVRRTYAELDEVWNERAASLNAALAEAGLPVRVVNLASIWTIVYTAPSRYNWMLQYYLRREGLALAWVGTGRLIFSHDYSDADFAAVAGRMVAAARAMEADGWWWQPPGLTNASIKRQILREMLSAGLGRTRSDRSAPPAADTAAIWRRAARHETDR
jgi:glutamate-1-semialdehyde 2,1-aminomutase